MEKNSAKIDSWEPVDKEEEFKYPNGKEKSDSEVSKKVRDSLYPELIKAINEGIGEIK